MKKCLEKDLAPVRYTPRMSPYVSGCVQVENTDKKFLARIMNPNGAWTVGASANRSSVHSFVRILPTFYGNSIANISIHARIVAHGTTLPRPALLTLLSFPSYITRLPWRAFLSRTHVAPFALHSFASLLRSGIQRPVNDRRTNQGDAPSIHLPPKAFVRSIYVRGVQRITLMFEIIVTFRDRRLR